MSTAALVDNTPSPASADTAAPVDTRSGRTELGMISISDTVVSKIASRAAAEDPDAGASASRILGVTLPGVGHLGGQGTDLNAAPKAGVEVDGDSAFVNLQISVRWPASIATVADRVRNQVIRRVAELTGLQVQEVHITVADLVTDLAPPPRVR